MTTPAARLSRFGVEPQRVARSVDLLRPGAPAAAERLVERLAAAADPGLALASLERLLDATSDAASLASLSADEWSDLFTLLGSSQALANTLHGAGDSWVELFRACAAAPARGAVDHEAALYAAATESWESFSEQLRRYRHREYLRIGLNDLAGRYTVDTTVAQLSALASGVFATAYAWARRTLSEDYGELRLPLPEPAASRHQRRVRRPTEPNGFVVMAMGKLGGGELNFSSDVDVMYLYELDAGSSVGGRRGGLEAREYCARLAELITRALQEVTAAGFAFRVDLRLRPDGINGPIANPLANALLYYESYGQTWERTALIQACPIAGSIVLGEQFLLDIRPFVFRRYLDYATVTDMKAMKARVEAELGAKAGRGNVKLGRGGIREIEFLVQVLQLINGGRDERVRTRGTLPTLARLVACRYVPADEGAALAEAYRFLRDVEHKIQIVHQRQTHSVPKEPREQETLARRLGYHGEDEVGQMWAAIDRHTDMVRRAFEKLFYEPAAETRRAGDHETGTLLQMLEQRDAAIARLRELGFARPDASYDNLRLLRDGPPSARARPQRKRVLYEVAPALLAAIQTSADPDLALENLTTFLLSIGARTSFLVLLRENPGILRMLVTLFGGSQFLANAFIRHPELLDNLVRADLVRVRRTAADLADELAALLGDATDFEESLDVLRRFRNQEFLRIGINDLQRVLEPEEVIAALATLAQVCVQSAATIAEHDVCQRYGYPGLPGRFVVLAMGKLGGGELNYNSDLDLIFVYREEGGATAELLAHEQFTKFVQRLLTVLQVATTEGIVYRIDTRLRPSGRSGPLVSSLDGFRRYHEQSAQIWERQALIKARPIAGDDALAAVVERVVEGFVYRAPLTREEIREIRRLRQRMERELARESREHVNIKTGRGGLVDVEFVTQMLQLHYGAGEPRLRSRNTSDALAALAVLGVLPADDHRRLTDGYRFIRRVENGLRLAHDRPVEDLDRGQVDLGVVARRMGFAGDALVAGEALWHAFEIHRNAIRACYDRWFDRVQADLD